MPTHLQQVKVEVPQTDLDTLSKWLEDRKNDYTPSAIEPKLDRCIAEELPAAVRRIRLLAVASIYTTVGELHTKFLYRILIAY